MICGECERGREAARAKQLTSCWSPSRWACACLCASQWLSSWVSPVYHYTDITGRLHTQEEAHPKSNSHTLHESSATQQLSIERTRVKTQLRAKQSTRTLHVCPCHVHPDIEEAEGERPADGRCNTAPASFSHSPGDKHTTRRLAQRFSNRKGKQPQALLQ